MEVKAKHLPREFIEQIFTKRMVFIRKMMKGKLDEGEVCLEFLRHLPVIASYGVAGLNAAIKGVGFVVKESLLPETVRNLKEFMKTNPSRGEALQYLLKNLYDEKKLDFQKLSTLELAKGHTYKNLCGNKQAVLLFFIPPKISYEVRCNVEIHLDDIYHEYVNAVHDLFHKLKIKRDWGKTPAYIFNIEEIYDNSSTKMGVKIY